MRMGGQRDIWTIGVKGENPVQVTNDSDNDWNPIWSHDGRTLYFASDRDGKMNLWRIPIDEQSGEPLGRPEPANLPGDYVKHFSLSKEGRLMAYVQESQKKTLYQVGFDPATGRVVGQPSPINPGSRLFGHPDCSPDGEWLVFTNQGEKQEDLFIMRRDGKGMTRLTNDLYKDRGPRWSPDGKRIVFYSDRSGKYELWLINPSDGGLQQITYTSESMIFAPIWSPDSQRILFRVSGLPSSCFLDLSKPWGEQKVEPLPLPAWADTDLRFAARDWSHDGHTLAGTMASRQRPNPSIMVYSLEKRQFEEVAQSGDAPLWLSDNRRIIYFDARALWLVDTRTKKRHEILTFGPSDQSGYTISPDNRTIYFSIDSTESDIWLRSVE
jgi:TolB protein